MDSYDAWQVFTIGALFGVLAGWGLAWHAARALQRPLPRPWRPLVRAWRWMEWWKLPEDIRWLLWDRTL